MIHHSPLVFDCVDCLGCVATNWPLGLGFGPAVPLGWVPRRPQSGLGFGTGLGTTLVLVAIRHLLQGIEHHMTDLIVCDPDTSRVSDLITKIAFVRQIIHSLQVDILLLGIIGE